MEYRHFLLVSLMFWTNLPAAKAFFCIFAKGFLDCCNKDCDAGEINYNIYNVQQKVKEAKSSIDNAASAVNVLNQDMRDAISGQNSKIDSITSDVTALRKEWKDIAALNRRLDSIKQNMEELKKEQVNITKTLTARFRSWEVGLLNNQNLLKNILYGVEEMKNMTWMTLGIGRNNSRKLDGLTESSLDNSNKMDNIKDISKATQEEVKEIAKKLEKCKCEDLESKVWKTADVMAIVVPLLIVILILIGFLLKTLFHSTKEHTEGRRKGNKNTPAQGIPDENASSVSSASEIDSDFENEPELNAGRVFKPPAEEHHTPGRNGRRDEWTFNLAYFTRETGGSIKSKVSNFYDYIRSSFRRSPTKPYLQNTNDPAEVGGLLDSENEENIESDNPGFGKEHKYSDYPQAMMTQVTVYDPENTKEEQIQKSCQDAPYNFTSFKVYNEMAEDCYPNADPHDGTGGCTEDCSSASKPTGANSLEEKWYEVSWKDYDNNPSTSGSPAGSSDHSLIAPEKSSDTDITADKSADEINERVSTEVNSADTCPSASKNWFSVQYKDYSDTGTKSVVPETDENGVDESFGTMRGSDASALPTMPAPSVIIPETVSSDGVSSVVNLHKSIEDGKKFDHLVTHRNKTDDFSLMNNESANKNTTKDEVEGGINTQMSKSPVGGEFNDKLSANSSTTIGLDLINFVDSRSEEFENKSQLKDELDSLPKETEEIAERFKPQVNDDIRVTMDAEKNEIQDNETGNDSEEQFLSGPSFETGALSEQFLDFPSFDNNEDNLGVTDVADTSGIMKSQEKKLDQSDDQNTEDPVQSTVSVTDGTDDADGEVNNTGNSLGFSGAHYEKLNKSDQNPPYAELFPPNMQDILKEMSDSAENILDFSRAEMKGSEPDDDNTGDGYDDDVSGYL